MVTPAVSAYPFERWPRVSRTQARWLRGVVRGLSLDGARRARAEADRLLGTSIRIGPAPAPQIVQLAELGATLRGPLLAVWFERCGGARAQPLLCELSPELGAALADRVLGGDGRSAHPICDRLDDLSAGALAYLAARMAVAVGAELRVRGVIRDAHEASAVLARGGDQVVAFSMSLQLGDQSCGELRLLCSEAAATQLAADGGRFDCTALGAALRALPVTLCAHAACVSLMQAELRSLAVGDVVVPDRCALVREREGFSGRLWLHAHGSARGFVCSARGHELVIETLDLAGEMAMTEGKRMQTESLDVSELDVQARAVAGDAPTELCLELARFTLPLDEVCALRAGEVLSTGKPIGERVTLSARGRPFARGELVAVDGDVGVRITELL